MVAYNFQKQFADDVESGKKTQTIRKAGKRNPPSPRCRMQLYTGMRTKNCRLLCAPMCKSVNEIKIIPKFGEVLLRYVDGIHWTIFDSQQSLEKFARDDGFESVEDFFAFFEKAADENGVFEGHLIEWEPIK